jgi:hypothetical protein
MIIGNNIMTLADLEWHNIHTEFRENHSDGSNVGIGLTDIAYTAL